VHCEQEKTFIEPEKGLKRTFENYVKPGGFFIDINSFLGEFLDYINVMNIGAKSKSKPQISQQNIV